jgi:hypothetical protein
MIQIVPATSFSKIRSLHNFTFLDKNVYLHFLWRRQTVDAEFPQS